MSERLHRPRIERALGLPRSNRRIATATAGVGLAALVGYDLTQRKHAILRNFPVIGHLRYLLEEVGPELRQYIVTSNDEELPFSRNQRSWIYQSSKQVIDTIGYGSDNQMEHTAGYLIIKQAEFPYPPPADGRPGTAPDHTIPCGKVLGAATGRRLAFRPASIVNVSGMSYGALSGPAVEALNRGVALAGCLQNTGEGGLSDHHCHGGELVFQIGTGYFGCRDDDGQFSLSALQETIARAPVRALEVKLSQGAKPGVGGHLPGAKVTPEVARIRGVAVGEDVTSPPMHSAFNGADELLDFVTMLGDATGLPVGIKSAVGQGAFWVELAELMAAGDRGVDHITIDGGEGGTGAAPLAFADHVGMPFKLAFTSVYREFATRGVADQVVWIGSGKLGLPESALFALAMGCDMVSVGREAMLSIGCIQAQRCHTGRCPTGVATQNAWLTRGLDPATKSVRAANYLVSMRKQMLALARTCGHPHPSLITPDEIEFLTDEFSSKSAREHFGYAAEWAAPGAERRAGLEKLMG